MLIRFGVKCKNLPSSCLMLKIVGSRRCKLIKYTLICSKSTLKIYLFESLNLSYLWDKESWNSMKSIKLVLFIGTFDRWIMLRSFLDSNILYLQRQYPMILLTAVLLKMMVQISLQWFITVNNYDILKQYIFKHNKNKMC